jgi:hypothetical protein
MVILLIKHLDADLAKIELGPDLYLFLLKLGTFADLKLRNGWWKGHGWRIEIQDQMRIDFLRHQGV